ncbi:protein phosphatase 2C domain-containing protein [Nonomuraea wenchangensis]|uniref:Protein phosphatase 2C n=1 Tax=Nonomuraea wenchangensis TaxID=568860 RepID=A0A1I0BXF9_9ACTN|nr:protein phosphatase 2C domain-containing protein [Nonomuraea wenchangensis]SET11847.1 Protein phosphatase 2C [Nonomuraea wenchangensis]
MTLGTPGSGHPGPPAVVDDDSGAPSVGRLSPGFHTRLDGTNGLRVPSVVADAGQLGPYWIAAAALTGLAHLHRGRTGQDAYAFHLDEDTGAAAVAVADGLGSRPRTSQIGAYTLVQAICEQLPALPVPAAVAAANERLLDLRDPRLGGGDEPLSSVTCFARLPADPLTEPVVVGRVGDCAAFSLADDGFAPIFERGGGALNEAVAALPSRDPAHGLETAPLAPGGARALILASDGLAEDVHGSPAVRAWLASRWRLPCHTAWMLNSLRYRRQGSQDDRTALVVWIPPFPEPAGD